MRIYALMWGNLVLYVGKTKQTLQKRAIKHRSLKSNKTCSKYIPNYIQWEIVLIDTVPDDEATKWEQYYYDELMPLYNAYRPGNDWGKEHPEYYRDYKIEWRKKNIESAREYNRKKQREYYAKKNSV